MKEEWKDNQLSVAQPVADCPAPTKYNFPFELLSKGEPATPADIEEMEDTAREICRTLADCGVMITSATFTHGPTVTRYELTPERVTKLYKIEGLSTEVAMALLVRSVRIQPIPGTDKVGVEVPNKKRDTVYLRELIEAPEFSDDPSPLTLAIGKDVGGNNYYMDLAKMPHLLIGGATGQGTSIAINCILVSLFAKTLPKEVSVLYIDPKKYEFDRYENFPYWLVPTVHDLGEAIATLNYAEDEMERRFGIFERYGVQSIEEYNRSVSEESEYLPKLVIVIEELADLIAVARREVERSISNLVVKAHVVGIHLIIGTQRPSKDVISGTLKGNIPARIACTVASYVNSMVILDEAGAEKLTGRGDMLCKKAGAFYSDRVQQAFISDPEVANVLTYIRSRNLKSNYREDVWKEIREGGLALREKIKSEEEVNHAEFTDTKFRDALEIAITEKEISGSLLQRRMGIGPGSTDRLLRIMEYYGYISVPDEQGRRRILLSAEEYLNKKVNGTLDPNHLYGSEKYR